MGGIGHRFSPAGSPVDPGSAPSRLRHSLPWWRWGESNPRANTFLYNLYKLSQTFKL